MSIEDIRVIGLKNPGGAIPVWVVK